MKKVSRDDDVTREVTLAQHDNSCRMVEDTYFLYAKDYLTTQFMPVICRSIGCFYKLYDTARVLEVYDNLSLLMVFKFPTFLFNVTFLLASFLFM